MPFFKKKIPNEAYSFDDIIKGLQHAVNSAQDMLTAQHLDSLSAFFDEDGSPVAQVIKTDEGTITVPLLALVPQNTLAIDEIKLDFVTRIKNITHGAVKVPNSSGQEIASAGLDLDFDSSAPPNEVDTVKVSLKFKVIPQTEALSRIIDEQINKL